MDPITALGLPFLVLNAFRDIYSTAQFIRETASSIRDYENEQSRVINRFEVQIARLEAFTLILSGGKSNKPDIVYLKTVPEKYLRLVANIFRYLRIILDEYMGFAVEDYKKEQKLLTGASGQDDPKAQSPLDSAEANNSASTGGDTQPNSSPEAPRKTLFKIPWFSKPKKQHKHTISLDSLHPGMRWLFHKKKMEETLADFTKWNDDLRELIPALLQGFGINADEKVQNRFRDEKVRSGLNQQAVINEIEGHIILSNLTRDSAKGVKTPDDLKVLPISWEQAQLKMSANRIVVEHKKSTAAQVQAANVQQETFAPELARLLRKAGEHDFRTLRLNSYAWEPSHKMCYFFFDYPADAGDAEPQSLYDLIRSTNPDYKLDLAQRFHIARTVARTLGAFHCDGWVHKGVRAKAIKFFFDKQGENCGFSRPYLTEFEISRPDAGDTYLEPTLRDMEHDVYRHPLRYGLPTKRFTKTHDIYSLGVVLLEIGLWCTATDIHDDLIKENFDGNAPPEGVTGALMQETLVSKAKTQLRHQMGAAYEDAVMSCLNCELDSFLYGPDFASEFQSRIVEKVDMKALIGWSQTHRADESVVEGG